MIDIFIIFNTFLHNIFRCIWETFSRISSIFFLWLENNEKFHTFIWILVKPKKENEPKSLVFKFDVSLLNIFLNHHKLIPNPFNLHFNSDFPHKIVTNCWLRRESWLMTILIKIKWTTNQLKMNGSQNYQLHISHTWMT